MLVFKSPIVDRVNMNLSIRFAVDIGVKQDGLLHQSQIPHGTILKVGDIMDVEIQKIEAGRGRIGLGWVK
jgi:transcriptional accessory protein Tex/SPT6